MKALKILFADDDLKYSMLLKRFLEKEGYEVTYAGNGKIALEQFPLIKPDLVLLDINMPGYNGFEVAERIRETDKHVLIFFLSDRSDKADRLQGFQLRANDYLAKPFYPEELIARIHERFTSQLSDTVEEETYRLVSLSSITVPMKYEREIIKYLLPPVRQRSSACWRRISTWL